MSSAETDYVTTVEPVVEIPPQPGDESAGPALSALVEESRHTRELLGRLLADTRSRDLYEEFDLSVPFPTDGSGNASVLLFAVPAGATGYLTLLALDEAAVTPSTPDSRATLALAVHRGPASGTLFTPAPGTLLDCAPQTPGIATQIPISFNYGEPRTAPRVIGPSAFWLVVQNANATRSCFARGTVCVDRRRG